MTPTANALDSILASEQPTSSPGRTILTAIRRMAIGGINDAHAAHMMFIDFGLHYRRPLVLLRAFVLEMSRVSQRAMMVAPCCCQRMTHDEHAMIEAIASAEGDPHRAYQQLKRLLATENCLGTLSSAQAVGMALKDQGRPLALD